MKSKLFFLVLFTVNINIYSQLDNYILIDDYLKKGYFTNKYNKTIYNTAIDFITGTKYEGKLKINNKNYSKNDLNIFIFSKDPEGYFSKCNCRAYAKNLIVCDETILNSLMEKVQFDLNETLGGGNRMVSMSNSQDFLDLDSLLLGYLISNSQYRHFIISYVINHEISHLLLDHIELLSVGNSNINQVEKEADSIALNKYINRSSEHNHIAWMTISNFLSSIYPQKTLSSYIEKNEDLLFSYSNENQHPEWLVRFINLGYMARPNDDYYVFLKNRLKIKKVNQRKKHNSQLKIDFCSVSQKDSTAMLQVIEKAFKNLDIEWITNHLFNLKGYSDYDNYTLLLEYIYKTKKDSLLSKNPDSIYSSYRSIITKEFGEYFYLKSDYLTAEDYYLKSLEYGNDVKKELYKINYELEEFKHKFKGFLNISYDEIFDEEYMAIKLLNMHQSGYIPESCAIKQVLEEAFPSLTNKQHLHYKYSWSDKLISQYNSINCSEENSLISSNLLQLASLYADYLYRTKSYKNAENLNLKLINSISQDPTLDLEKKDTHIGALLNFHGMILSALGQRLKAIEWYKKSLKLRRSNLEKYAAKDINLFYLGQTLYNIGNTQISKKNKTKFYLKSISNYELIDLSKIEFQNLIEISKSYISLSNTFYKNGDYDKSVEIVEGFINRIFLLKENPDAIKLAASLTEFYVSQLEKTKLTNKDEYKTKMKNLTLLFEDRLKKIKNDKD